MKTPWKIAATLGAALAAGCSTSPCADFLDHFFPSKPPANVGPGRGGVCQPAPLGAGGAISPNALPPGPDNPLSQPPPLSPVVPPLGAPPMGSVTEPTPFPLMSAPPAARPETQPLPMPPASSPPP